MADFNIKYFEGLDDGIAEHLCRINTAGFKTASSCSGLKDSHKRGLNGFSEYIDFAYIAFAENSRILRIKANEAGWKRNTSQYNHKKQAGHICFVFPAYDDTRTRKAWEKLANKLEQVRTDV